jgi:hypothetical protein
MLLRGAVLAIVLLGLTGCAGRSYNPFADSGPLLPCPKTRVLADAGEITRFREGGGRDISDVLFSGRMVDLIGACEHDIDDDTRAGRMTMELAPVMAFERGPADRSRAAQFEYFVILLDSARTPISKNLFAVKVPFEGNANRVTYTDTSITLKVPLKSGQSGRDFEILLGFQLAKDEVEHNRTQAATRVR